jgi:hypothetical protein
MADDRSPPHIGTLNEKSLHAALKLWIAKPDDEFEVRVGRYVIDLVRDDLLIEIQTRNFSAIKSKLKNLIQNHRVHLVYPIAAEKWIVKLPKDDDDKATRRKSPKRGRIEDIFYELVRMPTLIHHPNLTLQVLLIQEEEIRRFDGKLGWRRKGWVTQERLLLDSVDDRTFHSPVELGALLPDALPEPFTTSDIAGVSGLSKRLVGKMAFCLRELGVIEAAGKQGNSILYRRAN